MLETMSTADAADQHPGPTTSGIDIGRVVELDVDRCELWRLIATDDGWRDWLVDDARLVDGAGIVVDGGVVRHVRMDEVDAGRSVSFTWWEDDDPSTVSHVRLTIDDPDGDDGRSRLQITERRLSGAPLTAEAKVAWEVRVCSLWACTVAAALVV
jgi:uncharacterized protein YndB with AHSA1/START domain